MSELWTTKQLKHYNRTGEEPGAQPVGEKKPKAPRRTQPKRSNEVPLSVEAAYQIFQVKAALAREACKVADVARAVYEALSEAAERSAEAQQKCGEGEPL